MKNKLIVDFFREIVRNFGRFISIFFIVMLGTAFFAGLRSSGSDMRISADKFYDDTKLMDFKILSTLGLTDEDLADIKMINGVESVEGGHTKEVILSAEKREVVIKLIGITKGINEPYITAGRMPEKSDECLVDEEILWFTDYRLGDKIILSTDDDSNLSSDLKNGTYTITGFCNLPYYPERGSRGTSSVGDGSIDAFIMIPKENFKSDIYTEVYVAASNMKALMTYSKTYEDKIKVIKEDIKGLETKINGRRYEEVKIEAENKLKDAEKKLEKGRKKLAKAKRDVADIKEPDFYVIDRNMMEGYVSFKQNTERMDSLGNVFPVIFFLVAALVSLTAMTRMVDESRMSMGILKALGYSSLSISMKYISYALLATLGGGIIGVLLGERFLPLLIIKSYGTLFTGMPYCLTPINYEQALFGLLAAVLSTVVATLFSVLSQLLENPASLMRPLPPSSGRRVILEHIDFIWKRLNFTRKATIRNLARYKKRLIMTVVGIGGCMGLLLVGFGLKDSINEIAKKQYIKIFTYDANIALNSKAKTEEKEELINIINQYNGIDKTIKIKFQAVDLVNGDKIRNTNLFVPEDVVKIKDFLNLKNRTTGVEFDFPSGDGACISEKTAVMLGVNEGDVIKVQQEGKKQVSIKIEKIVENYVFHYLFLSPKLYTKLYGEEPEYNTINLKYDRTGINQQELGAKLLSYSGCSGVYFVDELEENIDRMLRVLDLVVLVLIVAAGLLAFVVLYNLNSINILERKRELATLKVLGFYDNEVSQYVYRENILLTFFGIMVGLIFGTILHRYVIVTVEVDMMMFGRNISIFSYIMSSLITIGFSVLVNLAMYFIIKKIDMTTSLKSVE